jgi:hypothetical protein
MQRFVKVTSLNVTRSHAQTLGACGKLSLKLIKVAGQSKHGMHFRISTHQIVTSPTFRLIHKKGNNMTAEGSPTIMMVRPKQGFGFSQFVETYLNCSKNDIVISFAGSTSYRKGA